MKSKDPSNRYLNRNFNLTSTCQLLFKPLESRTVSPQT